MKISVVIPVHNGAHFLPRSIGSVLAQTLEPAEVIVVDDGSTDNTAEVAIGLGVKVISLGSNGGISKTRNTGIRNALGDWVALLDCDDLWEPEKLERQVACIRPETVLIYSGIRIFDDKGIRGESRGIDPVLAGKMLRYCNPIVPSTVIMKREAVLQAGGFREDVRACEDWEMWMRLLRLGNFEAVADPLTQYYLHSSSLSSNPGRMLLGLDQILDTTLLADLKGFSRWAWRRRIRATQLCSAGLIARDNGLKDELHYLVSSLRVWPSPFWQPRRLAVFAVSLRNQLRRGATR